MVNKSEDLKLFKKEQANLLNTLLDEMFSNYQKDLLNGKFINELEITNMIKDMIATNFSEYQIEIAYCDLLKFAVGCRHTLDKDYYEIHVSFYINKNIYDKSHKLGFSRAFFAKEENKDEVKEG